MRRCATIPHDPNRTPGRDGTDPAGARSRRKIQQDLAAVEHQRALLASFAAVAATREQAPYVGCGLSTLGNTCFINATPQALVSAPNFVRSMRDAPHAPHCGCAPGAERNSCVLCQMEAHVLRDALALDRAAGGGSSGGVGDSSGGGGAPAGRQCGVVAPLGIIENLRNIDDKFYRGRQEDAHEFLLKLVDAMQRSIAPTDATVVANAAVEALRSAAAGESIAAALRNKPYPHRAFTWFSQSTVTCAECDGTSVTFDPFKDVGVEIDSESVTSVDDALATYFHAEPLPPSYKCARCKKCVRARGAPEAVHVHQAHRRRGCCGRSARGSQCRGLETRRQG